MKLTKFRIQNYKSIIDSGYCTLASDMTILIGKNESGKTATLEALKFFNKDVQRVPDDALPLDGSSREPLVEVCFRLEKGEIEAIQEASGVKLTDGAVEYLMENGLTVTKNGRGRYDLSEECITELFHQSATKQPVKYIKSAKEKLHELLNASHFPSIDYESSDENIQKESKEFIRSVKAYLPSIKDEYTQGEVVKAIRVIVKESVKLTEPQLPAQVDERSEQTMNSVAFFTERFVERLPRFIYFTEFSDILPFEVPINELKNNQAVLDFAKVSGLDLDYFIETLDVQKRINFLNRHSTDISGNFVEYWSQNKVELVVKSEGNNLLFGVKEQDGTDFFKVEQRSKGFQWFLSFYLRLKAQKSDNNFLIIDEPGMHLHAKAQQEILRILKNEIAQDAQIIFSTHCPYLIDPQRLDRIRLVLKDPKTGTKITSDIHSHADKEGMIPVMTAVGGERTSVTPLAGKRNIILTSVPDFYFWKGIKKYITNLDLSGINMLPAFDADKVEQLVSLMIGYGMEFQVLLNHNNEGWKIGQLLKEKFGFGDEKLIFVSEKLGYFTEDLFEREDFNNHVLGGEANSDPEVLNSIYLKNNSKNKVFLARGFYDKAERQNYKMILSEQTITSFQSVFEKILNRFHIVPEGEEQKSRLEDSKEKEGLEKLPEGTTKRRSLFAFLNKKII